MNMIKNTNLKIRIKYLILLIITIILGLASRKFANVLPSFIGKYSGDSLWALMVYWLVRFISPNISIVKSGIIALAFSYFIEISQLYHAEWIDNIRNTRLGGLILGFGFLWSDIICYTVGVSVGLIIEKINFSIAKRQNINFLKYFSKNT